VREKVQGCISFVAKINFRVSFLAFFLALPNIALTQQLSQEGRDIQLPSVVEVPIRLSLGRLFEMVEQEMPLQAGNWRQWKKAYGVWTRYRAWRGPLAISMYNNELLVQAHVRYWIQARKRLVGGVTLKSSCGVNESPRQAVIGMRIRFDWAADWTLYPRFQVMPTHFINQCEMTIANIDVTPLVAREFQNELRAKLQRSLMTLAPKLRATRYQAEQAWEQLQQPVQFWKDHWLLLNPQGLALSPLRGQGQWVDTRLALLMAPEVVASRAEPVTPRLQLPPLMQLYPQSTGVNLRLVLDTRYADISRAMAQVLVGETFDISGHQGSVEAIAVSGQGQRVSAKVRLGGELAGDVVITANLGFQAETQKFVLSDLQYDATLEDIWLETDARLLYNRLRKGLESSANQHIQEQIGQWRQRLMAVFDRFWTEELQPDLTPLHLKNVQVSLSENAIQLDGLLSGYVLLDH